MDAFLIFFHRITCIYVNIFNTWNKVGGGLSEEDPMPVQV